MKSKIPELEFGLSIYIPKYCKEMDNWRGDMTMIQASMTGNGVKQNTYRKPRNWECKQENYRGMMYQDGHLQGRNDNDTSFWMEWSKTSIEKNNWVSEKGIKEKWWLELHLSVSKQGKGREEMTVLQASMIGNRLEQNKKSNKTMVLKDSSPFTEQPIILWGKLEPLLGQCGTRVA